LGRLNWTLAEVREVIVETRRTKSLRLHVPGWAGHLPGQHVDIRLTAEDGYQAERSYSIASAPGDDEIEITVEELEDGEVSPYLAEELHPGDRLELRGPIGGYFTWDVSDGGPLVLLAGGSGVVPLMAILRHRKNMRSDVPVRLLYSARTIDDVIYLDELANLSEDPNTTISHTLTRTQPEGWDGYARRVDEALLREWTWPASDHPLAYVCGPTRFVEAAANALIALGYEPTRVKTERFGPTG
jgi:ferredoxin-NADP reductase